MNKLLLATLILVFSSCDNSEQLKIKRYDLNPIGDATIKVVELDSCEYIVSMRTNAISTIHKHNCKFCKQRIK